MKKFLPKLFLVFLIFLPLSFASPKTFAFGVFTKHSTPVLLTGPQSWDSVRVAHPSIFFEDNTIKLWFAGHNDQYWSSGYADSLNATDFSKYANNPVLFWDTNNQSEPKNFNTPSVFKDGSTYKLWYTSTPDDTTNFRVGYAESSNGFVWNKITYNALSLSSPTWGAGSQAHPFVLKVGSEYKMWFSSTDGGNWQIGLATSPDGITWTPYAGNPIITKTQIWEHNDFGGSSVIFDGTTYHMWYSTNSPFSINYATSPDGISWIKPADKNPVVLPGAAGTFDNQVVADPSVITLPNGTTLIYYTALGPYNSQTKLRIGLAADGPLPNGNPTPTPTPSPMPPATTKIVVVPGFGGSWNADAFLNCKSSGYEGNWILNPLAESIYSPLTDSLSRAGKLPLLYAYDWRKQIPDTISGLTQFIDANTVPNEKVDLVAHSMGGLLSTGYLQTSQQNNRLDHLVTVGSPLNGMPHAYPAWAAGKAWNDNFLFRSAMTILLKRCNKLHNLTDFESVHQYVPSIQNLLPTFNYLRDKKTKQLKSTSSLHIQNNWLPIGLSNPFFGVVVGTISGNNQKTLTSIIVKNPTNKQVNKGLWLDGNPTDKEYTKTGDGTVLGISSVISGATNTMLPLSHTGVIQNPLGVQTILDFLGIPSVQALTAQEPTSALVVMSYPSIFEVTDPDGKTKHDTSGIVAFANPKKGKYKLILQPKKFGNDIIVAQFLSDGRTLWKEYKHNSIFPKFATITFDEKNPIEDVMK